MVGEFSCPEVHWHVANSTELRPVPVCESVRRKDGRELWQDMWVQEALANANSEELPRLVGKKRLVGLADGVSFDGS